MSDLKYTQTRHIVLRLVAGPGVQVIYRCVNEARDTWKYEAICNGVIGGPEARCLGEMAKAGLVEHSERLDEPRRFRPVTVTLAGAKLLAQWDEKYGEVKA